MIAPSCFAFVAALLPPRGDPTPPTAPAPAANATSTATTITTDAQSVQALADLIDATLAQQWKAQKLEVAAPADDAAWLRRLSLDLCGTIPEREEVAAFLADDRGDRRSRKIDEYLADRACAQNLSDLWSNALLAGAQKGPPSARLRPWLEEQFAKNVPFADVTRALVSATGRNDENGAVSFVAAYAGDVEALSAVTARTLLGVQIQCAQCHDHPYDKWKQTDFNGFAAFFLGTKDRKLSDAPPVFRVDDVTPDDLRREQLRRILKGMRKQRMDGAEPGESEPEMDLEAYVAGLPAAQRERIEKARARQETFRDAHHLDGTPYADTRLLARRVALAEWIADPKNPWFAPAVVNRIWGHFFGKGLTDPIDDLTGSQDRILPELLATIATQFAQSGTDLRYLLGAFVRTRAYALGNSLERDADRRAEQERWFAAHPLRPFTAEQVLQSLLRATATEDKHVPRERGEEFERERMKLLEKFRYVFEDDEGGDAERFASSIPQALFLMNGRTTNDEISLKRSRMLDEILDESRGDRERLRQIFYATLNRAPTQREAEKLGRLVRGAKGGGKRGIEDLYWALLNCTEFLTNH